MKSKNYDLEHFKHEPYQNYQNYFFDLLDQEGSDIVDKLLDGFSEFTEKGINTSMQHIERRHFDMTEEEMVDKSLSTGQQQGIFATGYDEPMDKETFKDMLYSALFELGEEISKQFVDYDNPFRNVFTYNAGCCVGYGIDKNFNLVKTNCIELALKVSDDPFSKTGFEISTTYPSMNKTSTIIKSNEALKKEYNISERKISSFKAKQQFRKNIKMSKTEVAENRDEKNMISDEFKNR